MHFIAVVVALNLLPKMSVKLKQMAIPQHTKQQDIWFTCDLR